MSTQIRRESFDSDLETYAVRSSLASSKLLPHKSLSKRKIEAPVIQATDSEEKHKVPHKSKERCIKAKADVSSPVRFSLIRCEDELLVSLTQPDRVDASSPRQSLTKEAPRSVRHEIGQSK